MKRPQKNREEPIIIMLERLWDGKQVCPAIRKITNRRMGKASNWFVMKSSADLYEVESFEGGRFLVDLKGRSCSCKVWDLSGIPCRHGPSAISAEKKDPEQFVYPCYSVETYKNVYMSSLQPMVGVDMWEKTGYIPPLPPNFGRKRGRPSKARMRDLDEEPSGGSKKKKTKGEIHPNEECTQPDDSPPAT